jgi:hypothetical protein
MTMSRDGGRRLGVVLGLAALLAASASRADLLAADITLPREEQAKVDEALKKGIVWLKDKGATGGTAEGSLIGYALIKGGVSVDDPVIQGQRAALLKKIEGGCYGSRSVPRHFVYEAGCDAMFLEAVDPQAHQAELTLIRDFLVRNQLSSGGWYYASAPADPTGDTSITQYAILGLWAIQRAEIEVPREVWGKAAKYFTATQKGDGGFAYHPFEPPGTDPTRSTASMTAAGLGSVLILRLILFGPTSEAPAATPVTRRRFGVLEQRPEETDVEKAQKRQQAGDGGATRDMFKSMIPKAEGALAKLFESGLNFGNGPAPHPVYFLYGCERAGALKGSSTLGDVAWYSRGVDYLLQRQNAAGFWKVSGGYAAEIDTSFAILFLSRATKSLAPTGRPPRKIAGGLLVGGRGLPSDLKAVNVAEGNVKPVVPKGAVDTLLTQLEQPEEATVEQAPEKLVEQLDLSNPEALVGQIERLRKLVDHPQPEVRQVVAWALSRSGDYRVAPQLIAMLDDPDLVVAWEASLGLCVIARMPTGITPSGSPVAIPIAPPGALSETAEPDPALPTWREQAKRAWDGWYQQVRPYDERDDERQIRTK